MQVQCKSRGFIQSKTKAQSSHYWQNDQSRENNRKQTSMECTIRMQETDTQSREDSKLKSHESEAEASLSSWSWLIQRQK